MSRTRSDPAHGIPPPHHLPEALPALDEDASLSSRCQAGLRALWEGYCYACELGRDRWEFAVEMEFLRRAGLNNNDLRWLLSTGHLEHAQETTAPGRAPRRFRRGQKLVLGERSSFVLTDAGVALARALLAESLPKPPPAQSSDPEVPKWDAATHNLSWRGRLVKHFKHEAPFQEAILEAFQAANWPRYIVVMLPREEGVNP